MRFDGIDILPQDLAKMSVEDAMSYLGGAAESLSPKDIPGAPTREQSEAATKFYPLRSRLEDFADIAASMAEKQDPNDVRLLVVYLRKAAERVVEAARDFGVTSFDMKDGTLAETCGFVIEGARVMLKSHIGAGTVGDLF